MAVWFHLAAGSVNGVMKPLAHPAFVAALAEATGNRGVKAVHDTTRLALIIPEVSMPILSLIAFKVGSNYLHVFASTVHA